MRLLRPPALRPGNRIAVVCPSETGAVVSEAIWSRARAWFERRGHPVELGEHALVRHGDRGATVAERLHDLHAAFDDPSVGLVIAALGGTTAHELLDDLDVDRIAARPKILMGFSDTTALLAALHARIGLVTFYGPVFTGFAQPELPDYTVDGFLACARGEAPVTIEAAGRWADDPWFVRPLDRPRRWRESKGWTVVRPGRVEGPALAGELSTLLLLAGTRFMPDLDGRVVLIEGSEEHSPATVARCLTQLRHLGAYQRISGLVLGRFPLSVRFSSEDELSELLLDATGESSFPIVTGADFGHTHPTFTTPNGVACRLDTERRQLRFLEPATRVD